MRVLVVDDDENIRKLLVVVTESLGYRAFPAATVEEAVKLLPQVKPHVVLLDLLMNGTLSVPFIDAARQIMKKETPEIIVVSAMTGSCRVAQAHQVDCLPKPFDIDQLKERLEKIKRPES